MCKKIVIAIDGPAASGKSSVAKNLAEKLGFTYVDTGAMYRAITYLAIRKNIVDDVDAVIDLVKNIKIELKFENGLTRVFINGEEVTEHIRTPEVNAKVSEVSRIPEVRQELVKIQRKMGENGNLVAEGRDTTTVVFPNADLKIYLTADLDERATRRHLEYQEKGNNVSFDEVKENLKKRDTIDSQRKVSPLSKAEDAYELDTTDLTIEQEIENIIKKVEEIKAKKEMQN